MVLEISDCNARKYQTPPTIMNVPNTYPPHASKTRCGVLTSSGQLTINETPSTLKQTEKSQRNRIEPNPVSLLNGLYEKS